MLVSTVFKLSGMVKIIESLACSSVLRHVVRTWCDL